MGHIFLLCGPPGVGKTTLLKEVNDRKIKYKQLRRITTRKQRIEEGDKGKKSLEYEFLLPEEFAERLSKGNMVNLIEWNGNYYATQLSEIISSINSQEKAILLEDIPSAVALKSRYKSSVTIIFMFVAGKEDILHNIDFAFYKNTTNEHIVEWKRRLGLKYDDSVRIQNIEPSESGRLEYIEKKMSRAIHDLAFIAGKIRDNFDIKVIASQRGKLNDAVNEFVKITEHVVDNGKMSDISLGKDDFDPGKLKLRDIVGNMTAPQLWKTIAAILAVISVVALGSYKAGSNGWLLNNAAANNHLHSTQKEARVK